VEVTNTFKIAAENVPERYIVLDKGSLKLPSMAFKPGKWEKYILTRQLSQRLMPKKVKILITFIFPPILKQLII